jgi:hypothetical protein
MAKHPLLAPAFTPLGPFLRDRQSLDLASTKAQPRYITGKRRRRRWLRVVTLPPERLGATMTIFQPATPYSNSIVRPPCSICKMPMLLSRIDPEKPDHNIRTFECRGCGHFESFVVKYR